MYLEETCAIYLLVRSWVRRELQTRKMFLVKNLCCLLKRKASVGRELRLDDVSCIFEEACAIYLVVRPWVRREFTTRKWFL